MREEQEVIWTKVLLVGLDTGEEEDFEHSMEELGKLAEAAYKRVVGIITQKMETVNKGLYIGSGKVAEVKEFATQMEAEEIIFDNALTPSQMRNLGNELDMPVVDRTGLILDIFALRARTAEAKLQVETARLQYMLPRLMGMRENLSRQGGTGGSMSNKGAGETTLELDCITRDGLLLDFATAMTTARVRVKELNGKDLPGGRSVFTVRFEVKNVSELNAIRNRLLSIPDVVGARRGSN